MGDLIIDASIAADVCHGNNPEVTELLRARQNLYFRNWIYVGQKTELYKLLLGNITEGEKRQSKQVAREKLVVFNQYFLWLAALAEDGDTLSDPDPTTAAMLKAAFRLGENAKVLTEDVSLLARGAPFVDLQGAWKDTSAEPVIPFIDLRTQQDRIRPSLERSMHQVLHHGKYVGGPEIPELESALAEFAGVKHCVCVSSGTDALLIALLSFGIGYGDEVVTTTFSFIATCEAILLTGAIPVFVDVDKRTGNMDPEQLEARITSRTRAILPVSLYGQTANIKRINEVAALHQLPVIEDGAQSFGATHHGTRSCGLSTVGCTSFFPAKSLGAYGDAGACFTDDPSIAQVMREILNHGQQQRYDHIRLGINGRMDSLQAAVLLEKLKIFERELESRQIVSDRYSDLMSIFEQENKLKLPYIENGNCSAWSQYTIHVGDRDHLKQALTRVGVPTAIHYPHSLPDQPSLKRFYSEFPNSKSLAQTVLSLPMHPYLTLKDQTRIVEAIRAALL